MWLIPLERILYFFSKLNVDVRWKTFIHLVGRLRYVLIVFVLATVPNTGKYMSIKTHVGLYPRKLTTGARSTHFKHRETSALKSALIKIYAKSH